MFDRLINREINAEIIVTVLFMIISGFYIATVYDIGKILDTLLLWMFPASVIIFLTLVLVKIIERTHEKRVSKYKYVDWRRSK
jgi:cytochrome c-type biogenesis protein CcmH/NrfF